MRITEWLLENPVALDILRKQKKLKVSKEIFDLLISKLKAHHPEYFKNTLGLKTKITFKGYNYPVQASVPYSNNPVEFYKWWCANQNSVNMTLEEKIRLFDKVYYQKPNILIKDHKQLIKKNFG